MAKISARTLIGVLALTIIVALCSSFRNPSAAALTWEYKVVTLRYNSTEGESMLNRLGAEGWELAGVTPGRQDGPNFLEGYCLFKRQRR